MKKYFSLAVLAVFLMALISVGTVYAERRENDKDEPENSSHQEHRVHEPNIQDEDATLAEIQFEADKDRQLERLEDAIDRLETQAESDANDPAALFDSYQTGAPVPEVNNDAVEETVVKLEELRDDIESADSPEALDETAADLTDVIAPPQE